MQHSTACTAWHNTAGRDTTRQSTAQHSVTLHIHLVLVQFDWAVVWTCAQAYTSAYLLVATKCSFWHAVHLTACMVQNTPCLQPLSQQLCMVVVKAVLLWQISQERLRHGCIYWRGSQSAVDRHAEHRGPPGRRHLRCYHQTRQDRPCPAWLGHWHHTGLTPLFWASLAESCTLSRWARMWICKGLACAPGQFVSTSMYLQTMSKTVWSCQDDLPCWTWCDTLPIHNPWPWTFSSIQPETESPRCSGQRHQGWEPKLLICVTFK